MTARLASARFSFWGAVSTRDPNRLARESASTKTRFRDVEMFYSARESSQYVLDLAAYLTSPASCFRVQTRLSGYDEEGNVEKVKAAALLAGLLCVLGSGVSFAAQPQSVVVTNSPSSPVPVSGTVGVSGGVTVGNTQASPLFVTPTTGTTTTLAGTDSLTFATNGTVATTTVSVNKCSQIRIGVSTENDGDTVVVTVFNDLNFQLDQFIVGTGLGGNTINTSRVYDTPGLGVYMWLTPQNIPSGQPVTWAVYCR
jgi:hypothetical protein